MDQNYSSIIFLIPWFVFALIAISMFIQGWMIMNSKYGYSKYPKIKHPEMKNYKIGEGLLVIKFTEEDLNELQERIIKLKMDELFEEPSSYEDEDEE
jgi:hypothetical protein